MSIITELKHQKDEGYLSITYRHRLVERTGQYSHETCLAATKNHAGELGSFPEKFRTPLICSIAVKKNGDMLKHVPENLCTAELCLAAVANVGSMLKYVPENLRTPDICATALCNAKDFDTRSYRIDF